LPSNVEQRRDSHSRDDVAIRITSQVFAHRIVEAQLSVLRELHNGRGREHLVHRTETESGVEPVRRFVLAIRQTVSPLEDRFSVPGRENGA
jgi:hypothetical protein